MNRLHEKRKKCSEKRPSFLITGDPPHSGEQQKQPLKCIKNYPLDPGCSATGTSRWALRAA